MGRKIPLLVILLVLMQACNLGAPAATQAPLPDTTAVPLSDTALTSGETPAETETLPPDLSPTSPASGTAAVAPAASPTSLPGVIGPANFAPDVNPLTGQQVPDPALLARRPLAIKVENLPRGDRPQWGLSLADIVFEYYTERGTTRFIALFYGNDASRVGPIRSARFFDIYVVQGYKAVFAYGFAYVAEQDRLKASDFADRLVIQAPGTPLYQPPGSEAVMVSTEALSAYITRKGVENGRQNLDGMSFSSLLQPGGLPVRRIYVRYSSAIYNRWDYDTASARYRRSADTVDDFSGGLGEKYQGSTDRLTHEPLAFDNLVILYVPHILTAPDIYDIPLTGSGPAYAFRDGQAYLVTWQRSATGVLALVDANGAPFPFKPGTTWFEVVNTITTLEPSQPGWRFTQHMEP